MTDGRSRLLFIPATLALYASSSLCLGGNSPRSILSGDTADTVTGDRFTRFGVPSIDRDGRIAFSAVASPIKGGERAGVWIVGSHGVVPLAKSGDVAPGANGGVFLPSSFEVPILNPNGVAVVLGRLGLGSGVEPFVTPQNDVGIWHYTESGGSLYLRESDEAAGTGAGSRPRARLFGEVPSATHLTFGYLQNASGTSAFSWNIRHGRGVGDPNDGGIWTDDTGVHRLVARENDPAGVQQGYVFEFLDPPLLHDSGQIVYRGFVHEPLPDDFDRIEGIWVDDGMLEGPIVLEDDFVPGIQNARFDSFSHVTLNRSGDVYFLAELTRATPGQGAGIWAWPSGGGDIRSVVQEGVHHASVEYQPRQPDLPPMTTVRFSSIRLYTETDDSVLYLYDSAEGMWRRRPDGVFEPLIRDGDTPLGLEPLPRTPNAFESVLSLSANPAGDVLMHVFLNSGRALLGYDHESGETRFIAGEGHRFDVDPDPAVEDLRLVQRIRVLMNFTGVLASWNLRDGRASPINEDGAVVFALEFADGTSGVFTADVGASDEEEGLCRTDFDGNGTVDLDDFSIFAGQFGNTPAQCVDGGCSADLDGDGFVNLNDFSVFAFQFGSPGC